MARHSCEVAADNFAKRLKKLKELNPYKFICKSLDQTSNPFRDLQIAANQTILPPA